MKKLHLVAALAIVILSSSKTPEASERDVLSFISFNKAILQGQYDGSVTAGVLKTHGNFGVGSEEKLAGELVLLDGIAYTIADDGKARIMSDQAKIPFAAVKFFKSDKTISYSAFTKLKELEEFLDSSLTKNTIAAIKITGTFKKIKYRSFRKQDKPYKPIKDVSSAEFEKEQIEGTIVGYYTPKAAAFLNSPEYHFHFIDKSRTTGGHVLQCNVQNAIIEIDYPRSLEVLLPEPELIKDIDLSE